MARRYKGKVCKTGDGGKKKKEENDISKRRRRKHDRAKFFRNPDPTANRCVQFSRSPRWLTVKTERTLESLSLILSTTSDHATFYRSAMRSFYFHQPPSLPPIDRGWQRGCPGRSGPLPPASNFCLPGCLSNDKRDQAPTIGLNAIPSLWKPGQGCYY